MLLQACDSCPDGAKQLARALCANCEESCPSTRADVEREVRSFAANLVLCDVPPEQAVIQLKNLFNCLDGHMPSLARTIAPRSESPAHAGCCECYSWALTLCLDSYFDALQSRHRPADPPAAAVVCPVSMFSGLLHSNENTGAATRAHPCGSSHESAFTPECSIESRNRTTRS